MIVIFILEYNKKFKKSKTEPNMWNCVNGGCRRDKDGAYDTIEACQNNCHANSANISKNVTSNSGNATSQRDVRDMKDVRDMRDITQFQQQDYMYGSPPYSPITPYNPIGYPYVWNQALYPLNYYYGYGGIIGPQYNNGNNGNNKEIIYIEGRRGPRGHQGKQGLTGPTGPVGA
jgi:hypothetical protein